MVQQEKKAKKIEEKHSKEHCSKLPLSCILQLHEKSRNNSKKSRNLSTSDRRWYRLVHVRCPYFIEGCVQPFILLKAFICEVFFNFCIITYSLVLSLLQQYFKNGRVVLTTTIFL